MTPTCRDSLSGINDSFHILRKVKHMLSVNPLWFHSFTHKEIVFIEKRLIAAKERALAAVSRMLI